MKKHRNANPPLTDMIIPNFDTISSAVHPKWSWQIGVPTLKILYSEIILVINSGLKIGVVLFSDIYCFKDVNLRFHYHKVPEIHEKHNDTSPSSK